MFASRKRDLTSLITRNTPFSSAKSAVSACGNKIPIINEFADFDDENEEE